MNSKILLLSDVLEKAFKQGEHCLFGKRNFATIAGSKYDFYFHSLDGVRPENLKPSEFAQVPVLSYEYPRQEREAKIEMAELYRGKNLETFAIRDKETRITRLEGRKVDVRGNFLKFYSASEGKAGIEISDIDDYTITTSELMRKFLPNWRDVMTYLDLERGKIERG